MTERTRITEDELANSIIDGFEDGDADQPWASEVPYNHYGDRGVVDLVHRFDTGPGRDQLTVFELKSEYAVEQAGGASEILRQFNRHRRYFFDGSDYTRSDYFGVRFELAFTATQSNHEHVRENWEQYQTVLESGLLGESTAVTLRSPATTVPVLYFEDGRVHVPNELDALTEAIGE